MSINLDPAALTAFLDQYMEQRWAKMLDRRFFTGIVKRVSFPARGIRANTVVYVQRTGEKTIDQTPYTVPQWYTPVVGDIVEGIMRDDFNGYVFTPLSFNGTNLQQTMRFPMGGGWSHVQRLKKTVAAIDTTPEGDLVLPPSGTHAMVVWKALDTSVNSSASFGGLQIVTSEGTLRTSSYIWTDYSNANGGAVTGSGGNSSGWSAFVTTGGGTGGAWFSRGTIYIPWYSDSDTAAAAYWEIFQINSGTAVRRSGGGYWGGGQPLQRLHFFAGTGLLAVGTTFDLYVAA